MSPNKIITVKFLFQIILGFAIIFDDSVFAGAPSKGSCRAARKCCDGKDANCVVQNGNKNAASLNREQKVG